MRRSTALLATLAALLPAPGLGAQTIPAEAVARARPRLGLHPMAAADGRIPFTVSHDASLDARANGLLPLAPGLSSVRLRPEEIDAFGEAHPGLRLGYFPPLRPQLDQATPRSGGPAYRAATGEDGAGVVVGIIDTGLDVMHRDLRDTQGRTRVAWLLDLSQQPTGKHALLEELYGCNDPSTGGCAVLDAADIDGLLGLLNPVGLPRDSIGHGTHVASIAAGNGNASAGAAFAGMAPGATLIGARVTRGGSEDVSDGDAVLAARFIFEQADRMGLPAVVNMSLGSDFGAHDGSSPLETGLASFVGPARPGRALVVAAGNSGGMYVLDGTMYGIHTEARVAPGARVHVPTRAVAMTENEVRGSVYVWLTWRATDSISVGLVDSTGQQLVAPVPPGESGGTSVALVDPGIDVAIYNDLFDGQSPLTAGSHGAVIWFSGTWPATGDTSIVLEGNGLADLWLQGTDQAAPSSVGLGQMFVRGVKHGTVNVPATHPMLISVGATLNRASWRDAAGATIKVGRFGSQSPPVVDSVAYFSGAGPTALGAPKPDLCAPGVFIAAAMSRDADPRKNAYSMFGAPSGLCPSANDECYVVDSQHAIASGTSMAAPLVAGAIALLLARDRTLTQPELLALLQAGARYPDGLVPYPFQLGPGELDVEGARLAYEAADLPIEREPDAANSWVLMSAPYARPDPSQPVWGWVELRDSNKSIADGFDVSKLELLVEGATVARPLTRIAPGLWQFGVAAPDGSGGGTVRLEVRYDGARVGPAHALPVGPDLFLATEGVRAMGGGCGVAASGGAGGSAWSLLGTAAVLVWFGARRRGDRR